VADSEPLERGRAGPTVWMVAPGGGLRLTFTADAAAFVTRDEKHEPAALLFAVPEASRPDARTTLTVVGPDRDALQADRCGDMLVDLGLGQPTAFCVRTRNADLLAALRANEGASWRTALPALGPPLVAASPTRVLCGPLGRTEVYNPIPPPYGRSPAGSHTHLITGRLDRELNHADCDHGRWAHTPAGWTPAVTAWVRWADPSTKSRIDRWAIDGWASSAAGELRLG
jgi:hypothetical protein